VSSDHRPDPNERRRDPPPPPQEEFRLRLHRQLQRRRRAQREKQRPFYGLSVFGVVGWSVAIPTLLGIAIGVWIDRNWPSQYSWTLMFLFAGVALGCLNAWVWIDMTNRGE
jgi:ATP synthase protein I